MSTPENREAAKVRAAALLCERCLPLFVEAIDGLANADPDEVDPWFEVDLCPTCGARLARDGLRPDGEDN